MTLLGKEIVPACDVAGTFHLKSRHMRQIVIHKIRMNVIMQILEQIWVRRIGMTHVTPSMRLKVKRDTFFLPDPNRGVYFRNNLSSFHMEGSTVIQWIEQLLPMFNGEHTLKDLTDGLPGPYRDRVLEIAEVLYRNGFVRDVSQERPHQLTNQILKKFASQIEFLDSFGDSGAYRFQSYRQSKALAIGSGSFFISLVHALIESGLPKFDLVITDSVPTNRERLSELVANAGKTDLEVEIKEILLDSKGERSWRQIVQPFNSIIYVSQEGDVEELREIHAICREEKKLFLPAIIFNQVGLAGPLVDSDSKGCWESAWRRIHQSELEKNEQSPTFSSTAGALLANIIAFELFKESTGITESKQNNHFYLLDLETLEGVCHSFMPHPLVTGNMQAEWVQDFEVRLEQKPSKENLGEWFVYFSRLTSVQSGIFHSWEEGDLKQLPLAQCRVQVVDPMSEGPAQLLPDIICSDLKHEDARREAGLTGIEAYVSRTVRQLVSTLPPLQKTESHIEDIKEYVGIGAGETFAECVCRGLQRCLEDEFGQQKLNHKNSVTRVNVDTVEDECCRYYLKVLSSMQDSPIICLGREVSGFPVVWIGTRDSWHGCVGLNITIALRNALQQAIMKAKNQTICHKKQKLEVQKEMNPRNLKIPKCELTSHSEVLQSAIKILERNDKRLLVFEIEVDPFVKEELVGVFGVLLREEESR